MFAKWKTAQKNFEVKSHRQYISSGFKFLVTFFVFFFFFFSFCFQMLLDLNCTRYVWQHRIHISHTWCFTHTPGLHVSDMWHGFRKSLASFHMFYVIYTHIIKFSKWRKEKFHLPLSSNQSKGVLSGPSKIFTSYEGSNPLSNFPKKKRQLTFWKICMWFHPNDKHPK